MTRGKCVVRFVFGMTLGLVLALSGAAAQAQVMTIAVGPRPESITKGFDGKFFVSIQGPSGALNVIDGEIRRVDIQAGTVDPVPFATGLINPRGITFTGKYIVVADQLAVWRFDRQGNRVKLLDAAQLPPPTPPATIFFNDAAAEDGGKAVYVSEMGRRDLIRVAAVPPVLIPVDSQAAYDIPATSRVYRITMDGQFRSVFEPSRKLLVINGVTEIKRRHKLLVLDFFHGSVVEVDLKKGTKSILATALRGADGVEQASDGTIFVSSFENGAVWRLDEDGENPTQLLKDVGFQTTADFYLDEKAKQLYVPNTFAGTIIVLSTE
jgi:DNA-binding beta-propeller fold protein YncE